MKLCYHCFLLITALSFIAGEKEFQKEHYNETAINLEPAQKRIGLIEGHFIIGALFPIHERPLLFGKNNPLRCGDIKDIYGVQRVEAAFYAIDLINNDSSILPYIKLGIEIRDECWSAPVALHQTLGLIYKSVNHCDNSSGIACEYVPSPLIGLIGPAGSSVASVVHSLLQLFYIPQIGYSTTSKEFSDKKSYGYFLQIVPPDNYQAQAMIDILTYFNWTYVNVVYTNDNYGQGGINAFKSLLTSNICIAVEEGALTSDGPRHYDEIVTKLYKEQYANVVICFCEGITVQGLLSAIKRSNQTDKNRFIFIGSDGWAGRNDVIKNLEEYAVGSITIRIYSPRVEDFDHYYSKLKPGKNKRDPWFTELWQKQFNCTFDRKNNPQSHICTGQEDGKENYLQDPKLSLVIKSIYTYAHALHDMSNALCGPNVARPCTELLNFNTTIFWNYLMNVSFSQLNETIKYEKNGTSSINRYDILTYRSMDNGNYGYTKIGSWINNKLTINDTLELPKSKIKSVCSQPCLPGFEKKFKDKNCCWDCDPCSQNAVSNGTECKQCPLGSRPNTNKTSCEHIEPHYIRFTDIQAVISLSVSTVGIVATVFVFIVFFQYNNTPVVKSLTKELSYIMLTGMCLSHCIAFPMIAKPTDLTCAISRILPGFSFATIYAPLLLKTNRISRILSSSKKKFPKKNLRFATATDLLCISIVLIGIELVICIWMLIAEPAKAEIKQTDRLILTCNTSISGVIVPLLFNGLLVLMCTMYAFKTRSLPQNFNEAKFIGFSMYTTCLTWIAFGVIYFSSTLKVSIACICISTNALVILVFLFFPKVYIILFRPEKNNRIHFLTTKGIRVHFGSTSSNFREKPQSLSNSINAAQLQTTSGYAQLQQIPDESRKIRFRSTQCQTDPEK